MKKITILLFLFNCLSIIAQTFPLGDTDHNNTIDIIDALKIAQYYVGINPNNFDITIADVNADGNINIVDALLISQYYVGLIDRFPGEETSNCLVSGNFTYTLIKANNPSQEQLDAYVLITEAMDSAISYYNCYIDIQMHINVYFDPSVPTAQANYYGPISFGGKQYMNYITAMHEMAHCVGIGTTSQWQSMISGGMFTGSNATNQLREITGIPDDQLHGDSQHFWPYGLNYVSEVTGEQDLINHCKIVSAILLDLGLQNGYSYKFILTFYYNNQLYHLKQTQL